MFRPRIRTVKPETSKHLELFDSEKESGLPLRFAYVMLWCHCDRAGRFTWEPRRLKAEILPYDDIDFSRVLDALVTRGFVVKYTSENREYGWCPGIERHQLFNGREALSELPDIPEAFKKQYLDATPTREARVLDATTDLFPGTERNGTDRIGTETDIENAIAFSLVEASSKNGTTKAKTKVLGVYEKNWISEPWPSLRKFVALYNTLSPEQWAGVKNLDSSREKKIRAAVKDLPKEESWKAMYDLAHHSDFLISQCVAARRSGMDWLLSRGKDGTNNFIKVLEEKYRD